MTKALNDIEKLVAEVANAAISANTPLNEKMEALKLLQPYYAVLKKAKLRADDDPPDGPTMGAMRDRLRDVEEVPANGGGVKTASRRAGNDA